MHRLSIPPDPEFVRTLTAALGSQKRQGVKPTDASFAALVSGTRARLHALIDLVAGGDLDTFTFGLQMSEALRLAHTEAVILGRNLAGDLSPRELDDELFAAMVMRDQDKFLARFIGDIGAGRYSNDDGTLKLAQIKARANLYGSRLRGTANDVFVLASPVGALFAWHQLTVEPCEDCPRWEAGSPYLESQLTTKPGMGQTQCGVNCGCVLVRIDDGVIGFSRSYD